MEELRDFSEYQDMMQIFSSLYSSAQRALHFELFALNRENPLEMFKTSRKDQVIFLTLFIILAIYSCS